MKWEGQHNGLSSDFVDWENCASMGDTINACEQVTPISGCWNGTDWIDVHMAETGIREAEISDALVCRCTLAL